MEKAIEDEIKRVEADNSISPLLKSWLIARYKRCLKRLKGEIGVQIIKKEENGKDKAISYFSSQPLFSHKIMAYSIMVESGMISEAIEYLNSLVAEKPSQQDFILSSQLYMSYLSNPQDFVLNTIQKETLKQRGMAPNDLSGFSRGIYYALTGEKLRITPSDEPYSLPKLSSAVDSEIAESFKVFPNPVSNTLNIDIQSDRPLTSHIILLKNTLGQIVVQQNGVLGSNEIDISHLSPGIYYTEIMDHGQQVFIQKVIKL